MGLQTEIKRSEQDFRIPEKGAKSRSCVDNMATSCNLELNQNGQQNLGEKKEKYVFHLQLLK